MYNQVEYLKNEKRLFRHTEGSYWVNGLQVRNWENGKHYTFAFNILSIAFLLSWIKPTKSINLIIFKPSLYLLKN